MKTRVINKQNGGNYTDEWIAENLDKIVNRCISKAKYFR